MVNRKPRVALTGTKLYAMSPELPGNFHEEDYFGETECQDRLVCGCC